MKTKVLWLIFLAAFTVTSALLFPAYAADTKCQLAGKIGEEALKVFKTDKKEGLRLFLKAHTYCPDDANLNFNLGFGFFQYGNPKEAEAYLAKACEKAGHSGDWLNLLAWIMLENGSNKTKALEYARKASELMPDSPAIWDTLIRAYTENKRLYEAATKANKARHMWPKNEKIAARYSDALDAYTTYYLEKAKNAKYDEALEGLRKIDFDPDAADAYCWVLFKAGKTEEALSEAQKAKDRFSKAEGVKDTFDAIMDSFIQENYRAFKNGKRESACMAVKGMLNIYPEHKGLKEADDKMFHALLDEAHIIDVPEPMKITDRKRRPGTDVGRLLGELRGGEGIQEIDDGPIDRVQTDPPEGKIKRPDAVAVIIGNKNYSGYGHGISDVTYAIRDAAYMKRYVIKVFGYDEDNIIYSTDATQGQLRTIFGTKEDYKGQLYRYSGKGQPDIFIYYAGHGAPDIEGKSAYLVPVDANVDYISSNGYALDTLYDNLSRIKAKSITVVLDACFSGDSVGGVLMKGVSIAMLKPVSPVRRINNGVIFASADKDQVSNWFPERRQSLFTYFFMSGLWGKADADKDKCITVAEMKKYLNDQVPYRASRLGREQTPVIVGDDSWEIVRLK